MLDGDEEYLLVPLVMEMVAIESSEDLAYNIYETESEIISNLLGIQSASASSFQVAEIANDVWNCTMRAIGISSFLEAFDAVKSGNKAIIKRLGSKAIKKLASRFLGPIGVAIAVVDFTLCMAENLAQ